MLELCTRKATSVIELQVVLLSKRVNHVLGGMAVTPWVVNELPNDVIDTILSLERLAEMREGRKKVDDILNKWRNSHPNYRSN